MKWISSLLVLILSIPLIAQEEEPSGSSIIFLAYLHQRHVAKSTDSDGDGINDYYDTFPNDASESVDSDQDGIGDNADPDDDNDGISDDLDGAPLDSTRWKLSSDIPLFAVDWQSHLKKIEPIEKHYSPWPVALNVQPIWFNSLQIPQESITTTKTLFSSPIPRKPGVGYGTSDDLDSDTLVVAYSNWIPQLPAKGSAAVLIYKFGQPSELYLNSNIDGATKPQLIRNKDGSRVIFFPGVDEGKLISPSQSATSNSLVFDLDSFQWYDPNITLASHDSQVFDFDNDGDDDLLAHTWQNSSAVIIENDDNIFKSIPVGQRIDAMAYIPMVKNELAILDPNKFFVTNYFYDYLPERNIVVKYNEDWSAIVSVEMLPESYFEKSIFNNITLVSPSWEGNVGTSHDVTGRSIDIDYDGDLDLIIGSEVFSEEYDGGVIQILINQNGQYVDETEDRLFNYMLIGGAAHKLQFVDVNFDGYIDILASDHAAAGTWQVDQELDLGVRTRSQLLINDGDGHFVVVAHQQINPERKRYPTFIPSFDGQGIVRWTSFNFVDNESDVQDFNVITSELKTRLSTGPNGIDPSAWGVPKFNEFYYLLHNPTARIEVESGLYRTGLEHYLKVGKANGLKYHAAQLD